MSYRVGCPVPNCNRTVSKGKLMCPPHWGAVPPDVQRRVHRTYRAWLRDMGNAELMREYRSAAREATESV